MSKQDCDMIPFEAKFIRQTAASVTVVIDEDEIILPKSVLELEDEECLDSINYGNNISFSIPEWLATDRQLI